LSLLLVVSLFNDQTALEIRGVTQNLLLENFVSFVMMKPRMYFPFLFLICLQPLYAQQTYSITGKVTDALTGEPLAAANIRFLGTSKGTITNTQGVYVLSLQAGSYTIMYSYLAYQPETLTVSLIANLKQDAALKSSPIQIPEVVVLAEDPAVEIIRRAIANKHRWMDKLKSYRFEAFTRQVLRRDTSIASITESYTTGFMKQGDTLKEIVRQKRQTQNIPVAENFAAVRRIPNFNADEIDLFSIRMNNKRSSYMFVGPTAHDALDNYEYKLLKTSFQNHIEVYEIRMTPKSRLKPLFNGTITIASGTYAVMGVNVAPNESFTLPFVKDLELRYRQQFALYDSVFWMPTDIRIDGGLSVSIVGLSLPRINAEIVSSLYEYEINAPFPDSLSGKRRLTIDSSATKYDSTFWKEHEVLPLTLEEQHAYQTLDSTQTLEKQFEPGGPLGFLGNNKATGTVLDLLDFRFNRVEGFYLGGKKDTKIFSGRLKLDGSFGYGFSDTRTKYLIGGTVFPLTGHTLGIGGELTDRVEHIPDEGFYGALPITLTSLLNKNDYRDYYRAKGWKIFLSSSPKEEIEAQASFINEEQSSLGATTDYSFFFRSESYRLNPMIIEGTMRSVLLELRLGDEPVPLDLVSYKALELSVEHSSPHIAGSDFDFTRYHGVLSWSFTTFAPSLLFSPMLRIRISGGAGTGTFPPQRMFALESRASGYAPFGVLKGASVKEFVGERFVMLNIEHNFRSVPFLLLNMPFLYRNSIELVAHGSVGQTWTGTLSTTDGWYGEAGIGISRIFDLLRADVTYRFNNPKRFFFTLNLATLF
jgi:hypothetical protein